MAGGLLSPVLEPNAPSALEKKKRRYAAPQVETRVTKRAFVDFSNDVDGIYCNECGISFSRPYALRRHNRDIHDSGSEWLCEFDGCGKSFKRKDIRNRHIDTQHRHGKRICPICSSSVRKDGLSEHLASKACRAAGNRKSRHSQLYQNDAATSLLRDSKVPGCSHRVSEDGAPIELDDDIDEQRMHVESTPALASADSVSEIVNFTGYEEAGQVWEAPPNDAEAPVNKQLSASAVSTVQSRVRIPAALSSPDIVADGPPVILKDTLNELFLVDDASVTELAEEVEEKFLALEESVARARVSQQYSELRGDASSPLTTVRARQSYDVYMGSRCTLCGERLGRSLEDVLDHVKSHITARNQPSLECKDCKIRFAFQLDLKLHSNKTQTWSLSRELPPVEIHDQGDWVAEACAEAREAFISLLRSWETLQLHWYLTATNKLCEKYRKQQVKYKSDLTRFLRRSLDVMGFRHSDLTPAGDYDGRHISMNTLIQKFSATSLVVQNEPRAPYFERDLSTDGHAPREQRPNYTGALYVAAEGNADQFGQALSDFQVECNSNGAHQWVLEDVFRRACCDGRLSIAQRLLDVGVSIDAISTLGSSALGFAMCYDKPAVVRFLLKHGAVKAIFFNEHKKVLPYAYQKKFIDLTPEILRGGADIDARDSSGCTTLILAACDDNLEVAKMLLESGASVDCLEGVMQRPALHFAAARGYLELTRLLLDWGASIDKQDVGGNTALTQATSAGYETVVKLLLDRGASMSIRNQFGIDALHLAATYNRDQIRELLLAESNRRCGSQTVV